MARRKNRPETVRTKYDLSERLREVRVELYGERGGSEMARRLGVPIRTWYNYESGVTVPAEILLKFLELTSVEPQWLLHGGGKRFRSMSSFQDDGDPAGTVQALLRSALQHLERGRETGNGATLTRATAARDGEVGTTAADAQSGWRLAEREGRCVRVDGDGMTPILADGARVAYSAEEESPEELDGALVVAWIGGRPLVRWFRLSGNHGLLRAENTESAPGLQLLDLRGPRDESRVRRVLWISTPH